jgi:Inner membrane protein YgaP-like, transmembrane domain
MARKLLRKNMAAADRGLRLFVVAPAAIVAAIALGPTSIGGVVLFVVAGVMLVTGATGRCPNYVLLEIDTRGRKLPPH